MQSGTGTLRSKAVQSSKAGYWAGNVAPIGILAQAAENTEKKKETDLFGRLASAFPVGEQSSSRRLWHKRGEGCYPAVDCIPLM